MSFGEKKQILEYHHKNPDLSIRKIAKYFTELFGKEINRGTVHRIMQYADHILKMNDNQLQCKRTRPEKEVELMNELQSELLVRMSISDSVHINSNAGIKSLAEELAKNEKYEGFFVKFKFGERWVRSWRKLYNMPANVP